LVLPSARAGWRRSARGRLGNLASTNILEVDARERNL
jgi:hypothetical protein